MSRPSASLPDTARTLLSGLLMILLLACRAQGEGSSLKAPPEWRTLQEGLELAWAETSAREDGASSRLLLLRLDPERWRLEPRHYAAEETEEASGPPDPPEMEEWVRRTGAPVVFNAGFYDENRRHLGLLMRGGRNLGSGRHPKWNALLVSDPQEEGLPPLDILDLLEDDFSTEEPSYADAIQSLMILKDGEKRVGRTGKVASRTAAARDHRGRILVVWAEGAVSLWALADILDHAGLGIDRAMALDGGREAQVAVEVGDTRLRHHGGHLLGALGLAAGQAALPAVVLVLPRPRGGAPEP